MPQTPFPDTPSDGKPLKFRIKDFAGINNNVPRSSLNDNQFFWLENLVPVASGNMRALYSEAASILTPGQTINNVYFFNIGNVPFVIVFFSNGSATQVNLSNSATITVAGALTFFNSGDPCVPVAAQWNASGIIITSMTSNNAYWAWDSATLTASGAAAPAWLTNNNPTTMPAGVRGNAIEIYQNRVWVATKYNVVGAVNQPVSIITTSAPANGADFLTADGSVVVPQQDASLKQSFNALKQSNGYLYAFGDSNASAIYNVQTGGSPVITTYYNQNVDPQTGCSWTNTVQVIGQVTIFANHDGVYAMAGGAPAKISHELDNIFAGANFNFNPQPSAAVATIFGVRCYMLMLNARDQAGNLRSYMCVWDQKEWFIASQINTITQVYSQEFNGVLTAWGSDNMNLYKLFQTPNASLQKILISKLWSGGQNDDDFMVYKKAYRIYVTAINYSGAGAVTITGTVDNETTTTVALPTLTITNPGITITGGDVSAYGLLLGMTQNFSGTDFSLIDLALEYSEDATFLG